MFVSPEIWGHKNTDIYPYTWLISREILRCGLHTGGPSLQYEELLCVFFLLLCERSAKRDMGHILLPNDRIGSRET